MAADSKLSDTIMDFCEAFKIFKIIFGGGL